MKRRVHLLLAFAFAFTPVAAFAHPAAQAGGFLQGLAHPIGGLDHLLAMIAVGVVARSFDGMQRWLLPLTFLTSMTLGALLGAAHFDVPFVEVFIALSLVGFGIIVARAGQSFGVAATLTAAFALFHGHAHGTEMIGASASAYFVGFLIATTSLHALGLYLAHRLPKQHRALSLRIGGAGVAATGLVFLGAMI